MEIDRKVEEMELEETTNSNEINNVESQLMPSLKLEKQESSCHLDGQATEMKINDLIEIKSELSEINPEVNIKPITDIEVEDTKIQPPDSDNWKIELKIDNFIVHIKAEPSTIIKTEQSLPNPNESIPSYSETAETDNEDSCDSADPGVSINTLLQTWDKSKNNDSNTSNTKVNGTRKNNPSIPLENYFTEYELSFAEQVEEVEKRQFLPKYVQSPFKCTDCFEGFSCEKSFMKHRLQWHGNKPDHIECEICKKQIKEKRYYLHITDHKSIYNCGFCSYRAFNKRQARDHVVIHQGKLFTCPYCNIQFKYKSTYNNHLRVSHVTNFVCEFCGFSFTNERGLLVHKARKHILDSTTVTINADSPTCSTCNIRFVTDEALSTHLKISHAVEPGKKMRNDIHQKPSKIRKTCELCGKDIKDGRAYRSHFLREHPGKVPVEVPPVRYSKEKLPPCEFCGKVFKTRYRFMEHALVHSGITPYECSQCGQKFSHKGGYNNHMAYHDPTKPKLMRECEVCGKSYPSQGFILHMRKHSSKRPFKCQYCGRSYRFLKQLRGHEWHQHKDKPRHDLESVKMSTET